MTPLPDSDYYTFPKRSIYHLGKYKGSKKVEAGLFYFQPLKKMFGI
jgi:hypothetical protein